MATNTPVKPDEVASDPYAHPAASLPHARDSLVIVEKPQSIAMTPQVVEVDEESLERGETAAIVNPDQSMPIEKESRALGNPDRPIPTEEETQILRKVAGPIPWIIFILCIVEFAERGSYYAAVQVFSNFLQFPLPKSGNGAGAPPQNYTTPEMEKLSEQNAGALGKGQQFSQAFNLVFKFLAYTLPIFGAWLADVHIGRYRAIMLGVLICGVAHIIQIFGALPSVLQKDHGLAPFLISLFLLAIGAGIFKPNILPTVLDQYEEHEDYIQITRNGERVIVSHEVTTSRISGLFFAFVNIGALLGIGTSYAAKLVGFWLAFLIPGIIYFLLPVLLMVTKNKTKRAKPKGSEIDDFFKVIGMSLAMNKGKLFRKGFFEAAKPSNLAARGITQFRGKPISWTDKFVEDVRRTLDACGMFLWFPIWFLNDGGIGTLASSQAGGMTKGKGGTNDVLGNFNPLTIIFFIPLLTYIIYPTLERFHMMPGRITRITFGFTLAWISSVIGAILQWKVYTTHPCGYFATKCPDKTIDGVSPLSIWSQVPIFMLGAMSECFCQVTAYEIAYARAPKNMKALVMAILLFMNALSSAIALIVTPFIKDPTLIWAWVGPAVAMLVVSIIFYIQYRKMNNDEFMISEQLREAEGTEPDVERKLA